MEQLSTIVTFDEALKSGEVQYDPSGSPFFLNTSVDVVRALAEKHNWEYVDKISSTRKGGYMHRYRIDGRAELVIGEADPNPSVIMLAETLDIPLEAELTVHPFSEWYGGMFRDNKFEESQQLLAQDTLNIIKIISGEKIDALYQGCCVDLTFIAYHKA